MGSSTEPSKRRYIAVRVDSVPLEKRLQAARKVIQQEPELEMKQTVLMLAIHPGDLTAYIAA